MDSEAKDNLERDRRLDEAVVAYLEAAVAGCTPDREQWLSDHPELASELQAFFADQDEVVQWTAPLRPVAEAAQLDAAITAVLAQTIGGPAQPAPAPATSFGAFEDGL